MDDKKSHTDGLGYKPMSEEQIRLATAKIRRRVALEAGVAREIEIEENLARAAEAAPDRSKEEYRVTALEQISRLRELLRQDREDERVEELERSFDD